MISESSVLCNGRFVSGTSTLPRSNSVDVGPAGSSPYNSAGWLLSSNMSLTAVFLSLSSEIIPFTQICSGVQ